MKCRHCKHNLEHVFLDLGFAPPSNAYLSKSDLNKPEKYFPLRLSVCEKCWLVQTEDFATPDELFSSDYAYFSSVSSSWLTHARDYAKMIKDRLGLDQSSFVLEIASNDGYLLKNFVDVGIPCMGIEPTDSTAEMAEKKGIPVLREFFDQGLAERLADQGRQADLILGNNVFAHVPNLNDFTRGIKILLKGGGTVTLEFPHLMRLIERNQFDTVYHEHYSYFSLSTVLKIFAASELRVFDVEELSTHGGSLRIYGCHADDPRPTSNEVASLLQLELDQGLKKLETYLACQSRADKIKNDLVSFLIKEKEEGRSVAGYGAPAKGNTLLNYAGIKPDLLPYVCDAAPSKQGKYLPGSHIPILAPEALSEHRPNSVLILPWNISEEIMKQHAYIKDWGGRFVTAVPECGVLQ